MSKTTAAGKCLDISVQYASRADGLPERAKIRAWSRAALHRSRGGVRGWRSGGTARRTTEAEDIEADYFIGASDFHLMV